jgi:hypothetical protein
LCLFIAGSRKGLLCGTQEQIRVTAVRSCSFLGFRILTLGKII